MPTGNRQNGPNGPTTLPSSKRRTMLKAIALGGATGLAGCMGGGGNDGNGGGNGNNGGGGQGKGNGGQQQKGLPSIGGTFVNGVTTTSRGLNPLQIDDGETSDRLEWLWDGGINRQSEEVGDFWPMWFEKYDISDSFDSVEIKLRPNLQYSDKWGQMTAEDWIYNIEHIFTSEWFPYTYESNFEVKNEKGKESLIEVEKTGKYTLREELPTSRPFWPYNDPLQFVIPVPKSLAKPYVEKKDAKGLNKDPAVYESKIAGNLGPYKLKKWNRQSIYVYERDEDYYLRKWAKKDDRLPDMWAKAPYFEEGHVQYFKKQTTMRQAYKAGSIDQIGIPASKLSSFKKMEDTQIYKNPYVSFSSYLGMNQRANGWSQLRNKKVRWAMANLYNRNFICENVFDGKAVPQGTLHPAWGPYYPKDSELKDFKWTVERAKQLLKEGTSSDYGYSGENLVGPDGEQVELTYVYSGGDPQDQLEASYFKDRAKKAGIKVNLETTAWSAMLQNYGYNKQRAKGVPKDKNIGYGPDGKNHPSSFNWGPRDLAVSKKQWDLMNSLGFSYAPTDPIGTVYSLMGKKGNFNMYGNTPSYDLEKIKNQAKTGESIEAASKLITKALSKSSFSQPLVFESNPINFIAYNDNLAGLPPSPAKNYWTSQNWDWMYFAKSP